MCGRYTDPSSWDPNIAEFSITRITPDLSEWVRRFNVAPTNYGAVVFENSGVRVLDRFFWTFIPTWSKEGKPGKFSAINARDDRILESKLYAPSFKSKRCIVLAGGFYEWKGKKAPKQPFYIHRADGKTLAFAGVWSHWQCRDSDEERYSYAIVTTSANDFMKPLHHRMPDILEEADYAAWLDAANDDIEGLRDMLKPCPDDWLRTYRVSTYVNKVGNDGPECIERLRESDWTWCTLTFGAR